MGRIILRYPSFYGLENLRLHWTNQHQSIYDNKTTSSLTKSLGIIATLFVVLYFSRKQMQSLSVDIETKVLSDLDEKMHGLTQMAVERPELIRIISNIDQI